MRSYQEERALHADEEISEGNCSGVIKIWNPRDGLVRVGVLY
jgi:hypothetical protein